MWKFYKDNNMWTVQKEKGQVFHVSDRYEAIELCAVLNGYELECSAVWNTDKGH